MKAQISRYSYLPHKRFSGLYHIQGGMVTDADLDEKAEIGKHRVDNLGNDAIAEGAPAARGAIGLSSGKPVLREGIIYADGVRGELRRSPPNGPPASPELYDNQADFPNAPAIPSGAPLVLYADIWERPIYPLEDGDLVDPGLHGAQTAFRTRTMTQVKFAPLSAIPDIESGSGRFPRIGDAVLSAGELQEPPVQNICDPCADLVSAEVRFSNQLFRLEVVDVEGDADAPTSISLAWSFENAAEQYPANDVPETFWRDGAVYEFFSTATESHRGVFHSPGDRARSQFTDDRSVGDAPPLPFVRRWDGAARITGGTVQPLGTGATVDASDPARVTIDPGPITLDLARAGKSFVAGDHWLVEIREYARANERVRLVSETPIGPRHHYTILYEIEASGDTRLRGDADRRRLSFPSLSDIPASHVGFTDNCPPFYRGAENVQAALDNLCSITAKNIPFDNQCPALFDGAADVEAALNNLCKIDLGVERGYRLLFDWGVVCGLQVRLPSGSTTVVEVSPGAFLDRGGNLVDVPWTKSNPVDLTSDVKIAKELDTSGDDKVCLALEADAAGQITFHLVNESAAYGPADPSLVERIEACRQKIVKIKEMEPAYTALSRNVKTAFWLATRTLDNLDRDAALTGAEHNELMLFIGKVEPLYQALVSASTFKRYQARAQVIDKVLDPTGVSGSAADTRRAQHAIARQRLLNEEIQQVLTDCMCEALLPECPPPAGQRPYLVPIACLELGFPAGSTKPSKIDDVCLYCCRKTAMTPRNLRYWLGPVVDFLVPRLRHKCCPTPSSENGPQKPPFIFIDPRRPWTEQDLVEGFKYFGLMQEYGGKVPDHVLRDPVVVGLSEEKAVAELLQKGVTVQETIDLDEKSTRLGDLASAANFGEMLLAGGGLNLGDSVALIMQKGAAVGYVVTDRGGGFEELDRQGAAPSRSLTEIARLAEEMQAKESELKTGFAAMSTEADALAGRRVELEAQFGEMRTATEEVAMLEGDITRLKRERDSLTGEVTTLSELLVAARKQLDETRSESDTLASEVRKGLPLTAVVKGNPKLVERLVENGVTNLGEVAGLTPATIKKLVAAGLFTTSAGNKLKADAANLLKP